MSCPDCKGNILSKTPSLIGYTKCNGDCPESTTCLDIIPSNCVFYSGSNLSCSGILFGETITSAITKIDSLLCETAGCKIKVSNTDNCCEYLEDKITAGSGITITKQTANPSGCESLLIETSCGNWNNANLIPKFYNVPNFQTVQYSKTGCTVKIRGSVLNKTYSNIAPTIFILPVGYRPIADRFYTTFAIVPGNGGYNTVAHGVITIKASTGNVEFTTFEQGFNTANILRLSLELTFETN